MTGRVGPKPLHVLWPRHVVHIPTSGTDVGFIPGKKIPIYRFCDGDLATEILRRRSCDGDLVTEIDRNPYCNPYQNALFYPYCNPIKTRFSRAFGHFFVKQKRNEFCLRVCLGTQQPLLAPKPRLSDRTFGEMRGMQNTQRASVSPARWRGGFELLQRKHAAAGKTNHMR